MSPSNHRLAASGPTRTVYHKQFPNIATYPGIPESNLLYAGLQLGFTSTLRTELGWNFSTLASGSIGSGRDTTRGTSRAPAVTFILFVAIPFCAIKSSPTLSRFNICVGTWAACRGHCNSRFLNKDLGPLLGN